MFQSNAFQSFAFQTCGIGNSGGHITGGHFIPKKHGKHKRTLSNVLTIYNKAKELPRKETKELRDIISEFVAPEVSLQAILPDISRVNYEALEQNDLVYEKFSQALSNIQERLETAEQANIAFLARQGAEDEELLLMTTFACLIH